MIFKSKVKGPAPSKRSASRGFTLVELLVVIATIGLLAGIIIVNVSIVRQKSRDAKRKSDLASIQAALEMYNDENSRYPVTASSGATQQLSNRNQPWICDKTSPGPIQLTPTYISNLPKDPINNMSASPQSLVYRFDSNSNGTDYKLMAAMESSEGQRWAADDGGSYDTRFELFSAGGRSLADPGPDTTPCP